MVRYRVGAAACLAWRYVMAARRCRDGVSGRSGIRQGGIESVAATLKYDVIHAVIVSLLIIIHNYSTRCAAFACLCGDVCCPSALVSPRSNQGIFCSGSPLPFDESGFGL